MADEVRRYTFGPLERRGVIVGLQAVQLVTLGAGVMVALAAARAFPGPSGSILAAVVAMGSLAGSFWTMHGRPSASWVAVLGAWVGRRTTEPRLSPSPTGGRRAARCPGSGVIAVSEGQAGSVCHDVPAGIGLSTVPGRPGQLPFGLVHDRHHGTWAAVVPVQGRSFALLDPEDKVRRLDGWGALLAALARPGSPLRRVQWVERSAPGDPGSLARDFTARLPAGSPTAGPALAGATPGDVARASYAGLVSGAAPATHDHQVWLVLAVPAPRRSLPGRPGPPGGGGNRAVEALARELRLLDGQLRSADLAAGPPLDVASLRVLLAPVAPPPVAGNGSAPGPRWPLASDEAWSAWRADGSWHATYWVAEWPRLEVGPDFLAPLLLSGGRRAVSLTMAPVAPGRTAREAVAARTADLADEELRSRAGFVPTARRRREADGVTRREAELADGHAELRFSGYVTVSAPSRAALEEACAEAEHAAQASHLEVRRLYGRQAEAFTWTLPLGRGLT